MNVQNKKRESKFELLRIVCMIMILILHYCNSSMGGALDVKNVPEGTFNYYLVRVLESLSIIAVNCFVLITGYFTYKSDRIKVKKVLDLLFILFFYNILIYVVSLVLKLQKFDNKSFETFLKTLYEGGCWFIIIYIALYVMTPFLNIIIKNISQKQFKFLIVFMLLAFSIYPTFLSNTTVKDNGYGIVNFVMLYFMGAYISKFKKNDKNAILYFLMYLVMQSITFIVSIKKFTIIGAFAYNSIFNVVGSVALFLMFSKLDFKSKLINSVSKHTFAIYIIHVNIFINTYMWRTLLKTNRFYKSKYLLCNLGISVLLIFVAGLVIDIIREKIFNITIDKALKNNKVYNYEFTIEGNTRK